MPDGGQDFFFKPLVPPNSVIVGELTKYCPGHYPPSVKLPKGMALDSICVNKGLLCRDIIVGHIQKIKRDMCICSSACGGITNSAVQMKISVMSGQ